MIQLLLLLIIRCIIGYLHPFHLSICEIEHDDESKTLQITTRLFQDDLEVVLNRPSKTNSYFSEISEPEAEADLQAFFDQHLQVSIDHSLKQHRLLGFEIEESVVWCYLEIEKVKHLKEIKVQYTALFDAFDDQINLAHIRYGGKVKSLKFQKNQESGTANFAN